LANRTNAGQIGWAWRYAKPLQRRTIWAFSTIQMAGGMSATSSAEKAVRAAKAKVPGAKSPVAEPRQFWAIGFERQTASPQAWRRAFQRLVDRVIASPGVVLYDAVESGVPTYMVDLIAGATDVPVTRVMNVIGVSPTTYRRKDEAHQPLPDAAGHRVMGFIRVMATLRRLLAESGDPAQLAAFDLEAWVAQWMREPLPELGDKTPAEMLRNPEGQRAVEQVLERMRGGLPA
jgi:putative toxin-antitoxin system antitoxin component (TIGR02293 family)